MICIFIHLYLPIYISMYTYIYTYAYIHTYVHMYISMYIYMYTLLFGNLPVLRVFGGTVHPLMEASFSDIIILFHYFFFIAHACVVCVCSVE